LKEGVGFEWVEGVYIFGKAAKKAKGKEGGRGIGEKRRTVGVESVGVNNQGKSLIVCCRCRV